MGNSNCLSQGEWEELRKEYSRQSELHVQSPEKRRNVAHVEGTEGRPEAKKQEQGWWLRIVRR